MQVKTVDSLRATVEPDAGKIGAFIFSDPDVYGLELDRIFGRCWLFVAHESEVAAPGDYVTRSMGEDEVIVVRAEDDRVRVLLNSCRHRGRKICRADLGNASHFRCPYHGFTYKNTGELVGVPYYKEAYGDTLDRDEMGLLQARVDSYAGLLFATWHRQGPGLHEYLGDMKWYLDLLFGRAEMEVVEAPQRWRIPTNWKIPAENFATDAYHTANTHASLAEIRLAGGISYAKEGWQVCAGNGHALGVGTGGRDGCLNVPEELLPVFESKLERGQVDLLKKVSNVHGNIFPNCSFLFSASYQLNDERPASFTTIRQWQPRGPTQVEAYSWLLMERDAAESWRDASLKRYNLTQGAGGIVDQDDAENWSDITRVSQSPMASQLSYLYLIGLNRKPVQDFPGPGEVYEGKFCEAAGRHFYRRWRELCL